MLNRIKPPYNVSGLTQSTVLSALGQAGKVGDMVKTILEERDFLEKNLKQISLVRHIYPSDANFLLVRVPDAGQVYRYLVEKKIIVRDRSKVVLCDGCLRISVGTRSENEMLLEALAQYK